MAAQGVKLMERLKNTHGDKDTLRHQLGAVVGSKFGAGHCLVVPLDWFLFDLLLCVLQYLLSH